MTLGNLISNVQLINLGNSLWVVKAYCRNKVPDWLDGNVKQYTCWDLGANYVS